MIVKAILFNQALTAVAFLATGIIIGWIARRIRDHIRGFDHKVDEWRTTPHPKVDPFPEEHDDYGGDQMAIWWREVVSQR